MFQFSKDGLYALAAMNLLAAVSKFEIVPDMSVPGGGHVYMTINYIDDTDCYCKKVHKIVMHDLFEHVKQSRDVVKLLDEVFANIEAKKKDEDGRETRGWKT